MPLLEANYTINKRNNNITIYTIDSIIYKITII